MNEDDRDLYEAFAAVRREEEAGAPPMSIRPRVARDGERQRFSGRLAVGAVCLAAAIAATVWLLPGWHGLNRGREPGKVTASITTWKPATDFLLETPGRQMLTSVPAIGEWHGQATVPGRATPPRRIRKKAFH
jgi:hypothetical protein